MKVLISYLQPIVRILLLIAVFCTPLDGYSQAFETGYQAFLSGDYKRAKAFLQRGIKQTSDRYDKALMFKLLGITEYKLGSRKRAMGHFRRAVKLDPAIRITPEESRERPVLQMFAAAKRASGGGGRAATRRTGRASARQMARGGGRMQADGGSLLINLLPFGAGQLQQGKTLLGASFALGQAVGLGLFLERTQAANQADKDALEVINSFEAGDSDIQEDAFFVYLDQNESFVKAMRSEAQVGLLLFAGLYTAGVLEAILNPPEVPMMTPMRRRRAALEEAEKQLKPGEELDSLYLAQSHEANDKKQQFQFYFDWQQGQPRGMIMYQLQLR
ncbi:MAG: hypothetical protein ACOH5I_09715 [Oligoflexus sp.]